MVLFVIPVAPKEPFQCLKKQLSATDIALNPENNLLCIHSKSLSANGLFVQVFDLSTKARLARVKVLKPPRFFRWLDVKSIVVALETAVFKLQITQREANDFEYLFDLFPELTKQKNCKIKAIDQDKSWFLVCCLHNQPETMEKSNLLNHQLHCLDEDASQILTGQYAKLFRRKDGLFVYLINYYQKAVLSVLKIKETPDSPLSENVPQFPLEITSPVVHMEAVSHIVYIYTSEGQILSLDTLNGEQFKLSPFDKGVLPVAITCSLDTQIILDSKGNVYKLNSGLKIITSPKAVQISFTPTKSAATDKSPGAEPEAMPKPLEIKKPLESKSVETKSLENLARIEKQVEEKKPPVENLESYLINEEYLGAARVCSSKPCDIEFIKEVLARDSDQNETLKKTILFFDALSAFRELNNEESSAFAHAAVESGDTTFFETALDNNQVKATEETALLLTTCKDRHIEERGIEILGNLGLFQMAIEVLKKKQRYRNIADFVLERQYTPQKDIPLLLNVSTEANDLALDFGVYMLESVPKTSTQERASLAEEIHSVLKNIDFLEYAIEDKKEYGNLQTEYLKASFDSDPQDFNTALKKYSFYDSDAVATIKSVIPDIFQITNSEEWVPLIESNPKIIEESVVPACKNFSLSNWENVNVSIFLSSLFEALAKTRNPELITSVCSAVIESDSEYADSDIITLCALTTMLTSTEDVPFFIPPDAAKKNAHVLSKCAITMGYPNIAFDVLDMAGYHEHASMVIKDELDDVRKFVDYAKKVDEEKVWTLLGKMIGEISEHFEPLASVLQDLKMK